MPTARRLPSSNDVKDRSSFGMRRMHDGPTWRRPSFWVFFLIGAIAGAIFAPVVLLTGMVPGLTRTIESRALERLVDNVADVSRQTSAGASVFIWGFTLLTAVASAVLGSAWVQRSTGSANSPTVRQPASDGDE